MDSFQSLSSSQIKRKVSSRLSIPDRADSVLAFSDACGLILSDLIDLTACGSSPSEPWVSFGRIFSPLSKCAFVIST